MQMFFFLSKSRKSTPTGSALQLRRVWPKRVVEEFNKGEETDWWWPSLAPSPPPSPPLWWSSCWWSWWPRPSSWWPSPRSWPWSCPAPWSRPLPTRPSSLRVRGWELCTKSILRSSGVSLGFRCPLRFSLEKNSTFVRIISNFEF